MNTNQHGLNQLDINLSNRAKTKALLDNETVMKLFDIMKKRLTKEVVAVGYKSNEFLTMIERGMARPQGGLMSYVPNDDLGETAKELVHLGIFEILFQNSSMYQVTMAQEARLIHQAITFDLLYELKVWAAADADTAYYLPNVDQKYMDIVVQEGPPQLTYRFEYEGLDLFKMADIMKHDTAMDLLKVVAAGDSIQVEQNTPTVRLLRDLVKKGAAHIGESVIMMKDDHTEFEDDVQNLKRLKLVSLEKEDGCITCIQLLPETWKVVDVISTGHQDLVFEAIRNTCHSTPNLRPSAWDIAKVNGFQGTKEEWILSLKGPTEPVTEFSAVLKGPDLKVLKAILDHSNLMDWIRLVVGKQDLRPVGMPHKEDAMKVSILQGLWCADNNSMAFQQICNFTNAQGGEKFKEMDLSLQELVYLRVVRNRKDSNHYHFSDEGAVAFDCVKKRTVNDMRAAIIERLLNPPERQDILTAVYTYRGKEYTLLELSERRAALERFRSFSNGTMLKDFIIMYEGVEYNWDKVCESLRAMKDTGLWSSND